MKEDRERESKEEWKIKCARKWRTLDLWRSHLQGFCSEETPRKKEWNAQSNFVPSSSSQNPSSSSSQNPSTNPSKKSMQQNPSQNSSKTFVQKLCPKVCHVFLTGFVSAGPVLQSSTSKKPQLIHGLDGHAAIRVPAMLHMQQGWWDRNKKGRPKSGDRPTKNIFSELLTGLQIQSLIHSKLIMGYRYSIMHSVSNSRFWGCL